MQTIADLLRAHAEDDATALRFEDEHWSYREFVAACAVRAHLLLQLRREGPFHVGVLLDNEPEYLFLLGAAALAGAAIVGINPTRRGAELERDIRHADCQILLLGKNYLPLLDGLDLPVAEECLFVIGSEAWTQALRVHDGKPLPLATVDPLAPYLLIFTSGTTGDPKAAICSQARIKATGETIAQMRQLTASDVGYVVMPLFHSNSLMAGWTPFLAVGGSVVLRRKFSASGFLPDVRRYGCTYMNYVGKPLTYILATPEKSDDADNTLRQVFGNEAAVHDIERFEKRFGCQVVEGYGSTEGGIGIARTPKTPPAALGVGQPGTVVLDRESGQECPPAQFDEHGRLLNGDEAVGEIANTQSAVTFEGYWNNSEANEERTHDGIFWSGDLGYRDKQGFIYFAGRNFDWLRVDGENFAAAPIETILMRQDSVALATVYAVPNADVGDDVMAALLLRNGEEFDPKAFEAFLAQQADMGTKWAPRYVRIATEFPTTPSNKIIKRKLREEGWACSDPVWLRCDDGSYRLLTSSDLERLHQDFASRGRSALIGD